MTTIGITLLAALQIFNTPYPTDKPTLIPELFVRHHPVSWVRPFYVGANVSARCQPAEVLVWNPITALWRVESGFRLLGFTVSIGHQSEHGVDRVRKQTESMHYVKLEYVKEFW